MVAIAVFLLGVFINAATCSPNGPPSGACATLTPLGHNPSTGTGSAPYQVTVVPAMYGPGDELKVTVSKTGANDFRGIMVQARRKSGITNPVGTFKDASLGTKTTMCTTADSTWVHANPTDKGTVTATWTAPSSDVGNLVFQATVVQKNSDEVSIFYEGIKSADITYSATGNGNGAGTGNGNGAGMVRGSFLLTVGTLVLAIITCL